MADGVVDGAALDLALHGAVSDPRAYLVRFGYDPPPLDRVAVGARPLDAEVNHGTWIWRCPCSAGSETDLPTGGGVVFVECPVGWCARCGNVETAGAWRPLRLPAEHPAIDAALSVRPDVETRNWWPGETVDELIAENDAHGIGSESP